MEEVNAIVGTFDVPLHYEFSYPPIADHEYWMRDTELCIAHATPHMTHQQMSL